MQLGTWMFVVGKWMLAMLWGRTCQSKTQSLEEDAWHVEVKRRLAAAGCVGISSVNWEWVWEALWAFWEVLPVSQCWLLTLISSAELWKCKAGRVLFYYRSRQFFRLTLTYSPLPQKLYLGHLLPFEITSHHFFGFTSPSLRIIGCHVKDFISTVSAFQEISQYNFVWFPTCSKIYWWKLWCHKSGKMALKIFLSIMWNVFSWLPCPALSHCSDPQPGCAFHPHFFPFPCLSDRTVKQSSLT